jgi:beta-lactamase regulating signal transducer with metallopeptidase domain
MARADRAFVALVVLALALAAWIALPLTLTLFPALVDRMARGSGEAPFFCAGVLANVHTELPPFGIVALGLVAAALAPASATVLRVLRGPTVGARPVAVEIPSRLRELAARLHIADRVRCVDDAARYAYCAGALRPHICVSLGAVRALRPRELEAVLFHEAYHLSRRDPLRMLIVRGLAALFVAVPVVGELAARFEVAKELDADRAALRAQGRRDCMAGALLALGRGAPPRSRADMSLWSVSSVRIDQLEGVSDEHLLPSVTRRAVLGTMVALIVALVITLGQAVRAHLILLAFLPEAGGAVAHLCPIPVDGPLL